MTSIFRPDVAGYRKTPPAGNGCWVGWSSTHAVSPTAPNPSTASASPAGWAVSFGTRRPSMRRRRIGGPAGSATPGLTSGLPWARWPRRSLSGRAALWSCRFRLHRHNGCRSLLGACEGLLQRFEFTGQCVDLGRQSLRFCLIGRDRLLESLQLIKGLLQGRLHVVDRLSGWIWRNRFVLFHRNGFVDAQYDQENKRQ